MVVVTRKARNSHGTGIVVCSSNSLGFRLGQNYGEGHSQGWFQLRHITGCELYQYNHKQWASAFPSNHLSSHNQFVIAATDCHSERNGTQRIWLSRSCMVHIQRRNWDLRWHCTLDMFQYPAPGRQQHRNHPRQGHLRLIQLESNYNNSPLVQTFLTRKLFRNFSAGKVFKISPASSQPRLPIFTP